MLAAICATITRHLFFCGRILWLKEIETTFTPALLSWTGSCLERSLHAKRLPCLLT